MRVCEDSRPIRLQGLDEVDKVLNLLVVHRDAACCLRLSFECIKGFQPTIKVGSN